MVIQKVVGIQLRTSQGLHCGWAEGTEMWECLENYWKRRGCRAGEEELRTMPRILFWAIETVTNIKIRRKRPYLGEGLRL